MKCKNPILQNGNSYNCGRCMPCRINYTQMWSLRLIYELSTSNAASFITLTYNDENLPEDYGLHIKDLQDFWKRLRINLKREYHEFAPDIRYYACGEYGDKKKIYYSPGGTKPHGRPHYHAIVFGLCDLNDKHREILRKSWSKCEPWFFDKDRGRDSGMQEVTPDDINYVTGYVQKKLYGELSKETYGNSEPPFSASSNGLGLKFAEINKDRLLTNGFTFFKGHKVSIPRYFCEKFDVKKSELIKNDIPINIQKFEYESKELLDLFEQDMKKKGMWKNPGEIGNTIFMERRFTQWLEDRQFEAAQQIYKDFLQRRKLYGSKL